jgi:hypothetical protein
LLSLFGSTWIPSTAFACAHRAGSCVARGLRVGQRAAGEVAAPAMLHAAQVGLAAAFRIAVAVGAARHALERGAAPAGAVGRTGRARVVACTAMLGVLGQTRAAAAVAVAGAGIAAGDLAAPRLAARARPRHRARRPAAAAVGQGVEPRLATVVAQAVAIAKAGLAPGCRITRVAAALASWTACVDRASRLAIVASRADQAGHLRQRAAGATRPAVLGRVEPRLAAVRHLVIAVDETVVAADHLAAGLDAHGVGVVRRARRQVAGAHARARGIAGLGIARACVLPGQRIGRGVAEQLGIVRAARCDAQQQPGGH